MSVIKERLELVWRRPLAVALLLLLSGLVLALLSGEHLMQVRRLDPMLVVIQIATLSVLLSALLYAYLQGRQRTRQIWLNNARLAAIIESANDAIIGKNLDGVVTSWNKAAERIFGYPVEQALGHTLSELIVPVELADEERRILQCIGRGEMVPHFNTVRHRADGSLVNVSVTVSPVLAENGKVVGAAKTIRDVTDTLAADSRIRELNASLEAQVIRRTAELETARRDLQTVFDAVPSLIGYWDRELTIRVANQACRHWYGLAPDNLLGMRVSDLLGPEQYAEDLPHIEAALRGEPQTFERASRGPDGSRRHTLMYYLPDIVAGDVRGFYVIAHDVTEITSSRLRLTAAMRENEVLLRTINQQMLYSVTDVAGRILEVNDNFCRVSGYSREALVGQNHRMINSAVHPLTFWHDMWGTISSGQAWHGEVCNRSRNGSLYWVDSVIAPFIGADGRIERYVSVRTDITKRKAAEAELNHVATLLGNVLGSASEVSIIATDIDGLITIFNAGAEHMLNYAADEMIGKHSPAIFHCPDEVAARSAELSAEYGMPIEGFRVFVQKAELEGSEIREWSYTRKGGERILVSLAVTTMRDQQGVIVGYLGVAQDITARHQFESALRTAKAVAEEASQAKSEFLAKMSHEIRTPMNGILGMCYLLERQEIPPAPRGMVQKIQGASQSLLGIINDILDFSKIEAKRLDIEQVPFRLNDVIDNLAGIMASAVGDKPVEVVVSPAPQGAEYLKGDPLRLGQVLINLVGNAIKFTPRGEVIVAIRLIDSDADSNRLMLRFSVRDTGIGIAQDQLRRIFHAFSQADASTTRSFGGTGLGLTISRNLVELMGGSIEVNSVPGLGSEFVVDLPFECSHPSELVSPDMRLKRILIAGEHAQTCATLASSVSSLGWQPEVVVSGHDVLSRLADDNTDPCDVVLLDWRMPGLDGLETAAKLRRQGGSGDPVISILLASAKDAAMVREQPDFVHVDAVLVKPVTTSSLFGAVMDIERRRSQTSDSQPAPRSSGCRLAGVRVLVVDDSDLNRDVAGYILDGEGAVVTSAVDGRAALTLLETSPASVDVVLMDIQMPVMDGYEATRQIRANPALAHLPVVALTAGALHTQRDAALDAGMNGFIAKPFNVEDLVATVLGLVGQDGSVATDVTAPANDLDNDPAWLALTAEFAQRFRAGCARDFLALFDASHDIAPEDLSLELKRLSHKIAGQAAMAGHAGIGDQGRAIEQRWDELGTPDVTLHAMVTALAEAIRALPLL